MDACCHCGGGAKIAGILQYVIKNLGGSYLLHAKERCRVIGGEVGWIKKENQSQPKSLESFNFFKLLKETSYDLGCI